MEDDIPPSQAGLIPYDRWVQEAMRAVALRALRLAEAEGLPGEHHFYISFRTDHPDVAIPARLRAQYPDEMTIVLQHQFWDLKVDPAGAFFGVGLSFGGVPSALHIPLAALTGFADPHVGLAIRLKAELPDPAEPPAPTPPAEGEDIASEAAEEPQVVSLDAFRRKKE